MVNETGQAEKSTGRAVLKARLLIQALPKSEQARPNNLGLHIILTETKLNGCLHKIHFDSEVAVN